MFCFFSQNIVFHKITSPHSQAYPPFYKIVDEVLLKPMQTFIVARTNRIWNSAIDDFKPSTMYIKSKINRKCSANDNGHKAGDIYANDRLKS